MERRQDGSFTNVNGLGSSAASVAGSSSGAGAGTGSAKILRRQSEGLAKWLDGELEGFALSTGL